MLFLSDGFSEGTLGDFDLDAEAREGAEDLMWAERSELRGDLFVDVAHPDPRVVIFGAVEFAAHLSAPARIAGWRSLRRRSTRTLRHAGAVPEALDVVAAWPEEAFERLGAPDRATYIVILTHDPKLDDAALL
jgi:xanthine dehydrogenase accessory factor